MAALFMADPFAGVALAAFGGEADMQILQSGLLLGSVAAIALPWLRSTMPGRAARWMSTGFVALFACLVPICALLQADEGFARLAQFFCGAIGAIAHVLLLMEWAHALRALNARAVFTTAATAFALSGALLFGFEVFGSPAASLAAMAAAPCVSYLGLYLKKETCAQDKGHRVSEDGKTPSMRDGYWSLLFGEFVCAVVFGLMWAASSRSYQMSAGSFDSATLSHVLVSSFVAGSIALAAFGSVASDFDAARKRAEAALPLVVVLPFIPGVFSGYVLPYAVSVVVGLLTGFGFSALACAGFLVAFECVPGTSSFRSAWTSMIAAMAAGLTVGFGAAFVFVDGTDRMVLSVLLVAAYAVMYVFGMRRRASTELAAERASNAALESRCDAIAAKHALSPREREVLGHLAQGRSAPYISEKLFISPDTVRVHVRHIYEKTGVHSRQELLDYIQSDL